MGKLVTFLTMLMMIDLMFIVTGQLCNSGDACSFTSIIFAMMINPSTSTLSTWFTAIIGNIGDLLAGSSTSGGMGSLLGYLAAGAGIAVTVGSLIFGVKNDAVLFATTGIALSLLVGDFVNIYAYLYSGNPVVATIIMSPITVLYVFTCLEWLRGKD